MRSSAEGTHDGQIPHYVQWPDRVHRSLDLGRLEVVGASGGGDVGELLDVELAANVVVDADLDDVPSLHVAAASRGSAEDDVSLSEGGQLAGPLDDIGDGADGVGEKTALDLGAVHSAPDLGRQR
ncbi:hypothetical protein QR680_005477 [Steinernema hermaphroditum]|uniref:Uncharacterized protein n=1 Tax=Steinernema hermaphroditum TaxID=289476 RepID=A0AA39LVR4_9BILA|nr:hypothetical protein QR680_005477 [Steinernema hermaphroditum]